MRVYGVPISKVDDRGNDQSNGPIHQIICKLLDGFISFYLIFFLESIRLPHILNSTECDLLKYSSRSRKYKMTKVTLTPPNSFLLWFLSLLFEQRVADIHIS